jgi:hypothetical protein
MIAEWLLAGELGWEAPQGCPDAAFVRERLQAYVGDDAGPFTASVRVERVGEEHAASVEVVAEAGSNTRTLRAVDCTTLADAVALVIAVDVDVLAVASNPGVRAVTETPPPEPEPTPEPRLPLPEAVAPEVVAPRPSVASPPTSSRVALPRDLGFGVRFDVGFGLRALPRINLLAGLTAAIRWKRWRWEVGAAHHFAQPARLAAPDDDAGADVSLWAGTFRTRFVPARPPVEFPISIGIELGDMIGDGVGVSKSKVRHGLWGAGLLGAGLVFVPHPRVGLWLDPSLVLAFARPGFGVATPSGDRLAYQPGVAGFRATFGLEVRFP